MILVIQLIVSAQEIRQDEPAQKVQPRALVHMPSRQRPLNLPVGHLGREGLPVVGTLLVVEAFDARSAERVTARHQHHGPMKVRVVVVRADLALELDSVWPVGCERH